MARRGKASFLFLVCLVFSSAGHASGDCVWEYGLSDNYPFIVDNNTRMFVYPERENMELRQWKMVLAEGSKVLVACPGGGNALDLDGSNQMTLSVTCQNKKLLRNDKVKAPSGRFVSGPKLRCKNPPTPKVKEKDEDCGRGYVKHEIGWAISDFVIPQITACYIPGEDGSLFTKHTIHGRAIASKMTRTPRQQFMPVDESNLPFMYSRRYWTLTRNYNKDKTNIITKGHLAPHADFVTKAEQKATYYYINAAPQWRNVNSGNWAKVEDAVRNFANKRKATLDVYTGTLYILEISYKRTWLLLPEFFWKVIHNPTTRKAVAFVTVNGSGKRSERPCPDMCKTLQGINGADIRSFSDPSHGHTICCSVKDLPRSIKEVLPVKDPQILKIFSL